MKSNEIITILEKWQSDMMTSEKLVHISQFALQPQHEGFHLQLDLHIGDRDRELGDEYKDFFGTLSECIEQGLVWINEETERLRALL